MLWLLSIARPWQAGGGQASGGLWASVGRQAGRQAVGRQAAAGRVGGQRAGMLQPFRGVLYWNPFAAAINSVYSYIYI